MSDLFTASQFTRGPNYAGQASAILDAAQALDDDLDTLQEGAMRLLLEDYDLNEVVASIFDTEGLLAKIIKSYRANVKNPDGDAINAEIELLLRDALAGKARKMAERAREGF